MINKLLIKNYIKELKDRHKNYIGEYKISEKEFDLYLDYIKTNPLDLKTYTGFKHYHRG